MCWYQPNPPGCVCAFIQLIQPCKHATYSPPPSPTTNPNPIVHVCSQADFAKGTGVRVCLSCPEASQSRVNGVPIGLALSQMEDWARAFDCGQGQRRGFMAGDNKGRVGGESESDVAVLVPVMAGSDSSLDFGSYQGFKSEGDADATSTFAWPSASETKQWTKTELEDPYDITTPLPFGLKRRGLDFTLYPETGRKRRIAVAPTSIAASTLEPSFEDGSTGCLDGDDDERTVSPLLLELQSADGVSGAVRVGSGTETAAESPVEDEVEAGCQSHIFREVKVDEDTDGKVVRNVELEFEAEGVARLSGGYGTAEEVVIKVENEEMPSICPRIESMDRAGKNQLVTV